MVKAVQGPEQPQAATIPDSSANSDSAKGERADNAPATAQKATELSGSTDAAVSFSAPVNDKPLTYAEAVAHMNAKAQQSTSSAKEEPASDVKQPSSAKVAEAGKQAAADPATAVKAATSSDDAQGGGDHGHPAAPQQAAVSNKAIIAETAHAKPEAGQVIPGFDVQSQPADAMVKAQVASSAPMNQAKVIQVGEYTFNMVKNSNSSLELTLQPEGLGKLHLEVNLDRGVVSAHISAPDQATRATIERNMQGIMAELQKEGINVGGFSVDVRSNDGNGAASQGKNNGGRGASGTGADAPSGAEAVQAATSTDADRLVSVYA